MADQTKIDYSDLDRPALEEMLRDKIAELTQLKVDHALEIAEKDKAFVAVQKKAVGIYDKNAALQSQVLALRDHPEINRRKAEMEFELQLAGQFIASGAFPKLKPEQAYTLIQAGKEMGLAPLEAMNNLYIINGSINPYGKFMTARIKQAGYKIEYKDEDANHVTVRVYNDDGFDVSETVDAAELIAMKSKAFGFAPKSKMRYHGLRLFVNFHLAHLFGGVSDQHQGDYNVWAEEQKSPTMALDRAKEQDAANIALHIANAQDLATLRQVDQYVDDFDLRGQYDAKELTLTADAPTDEDGQ